MPRKGVTIIELLLACPEDVIDLLPVAKDCINEFNHLYGGLKDIMFEVKHWSTDGFPKLGEPSQETLNKQFIHKCDACVALFGNRFGTPTEQYGCGTEEEIELMIHSKKQVFLYFIERTIDPSTIDLLQLDKVRKFKEKYKNKGIYWLIKSNDEFRRLLLNHLILYIQQFDETLQKAPGGSSIFDEVRNIDISITVPKLDFLVDYYIIHVKDGKDEWLPNDRKMPLNQKIKMIQSSNNPNEYSATISTHGNIGFQFKCYAKCDYQHIGELIEALRNFYGTPPYYKVKYKHSSVKQGSTDYYVWFILPQYHIYETSDAFHPFLNNYYNI